MPRIVTTYIFKEMLPPFLLSTSILTITALLGKLLKLIELSLSKGVGLKYLFIFIISIIPSFLVYTVPAGFLVAVLIASTRLSSDNEITALKASGIGLFTVMKPVLTLAAISYVISLLVTLYLYPLGNYNLKKVVYNVAREKTTSAIEEKTFYDEFKDVVFYVDEIAHGGRELKGILLSEKKGGEESTLIIAEKGGFSSQPELQSVTLTMENGEIHRMSAKKDIYHILNFSTYTLELNFEEDRNEIKRQSRRELYVGELMERIEDAKRKNAPTATLLIDLYKRFSLPASVFAFALLAVPLGMQRVREARFTGFGLAIVVFLGYYVLSKTFETLGENNILNPAISAWATDVILATIGLYVFSRALKEKPLVIVNIFDNALTGIRERVKKIIGSA